MRLIDADKLKAHYSWWKGGSREMTMDEAKSDFDCIIDLQPTIDIDTITKAHADKGYEQGHRDGCAEAIEVRAAYKQKAYNDGYYDGYRDGAYGKAYKITDGGEND